MYYTDNEFYMTQSINNGEYKEMIHDSYYS